MTLVTRQVDGPLGRWTHTEWRPAHLAGVVECLWYFEGALTYPRERIFPNGLMELVVHFGAPYRLVEERGTDPFTTACFGGLQPAAMVIEAPPGPGSVLGVRMRPAGAYRLLGLPLSELTGLTVDLHDLVGRAAAELLERCHGAPSAAERLRLAGEWIAERTARSPGLDPAIAWTAAQIERREGAVSIAELREQTGLSKARLAATFREQIGVLPKLYARILRFHRVVAILGERAGSLADVALDAGYYDQPHMNAEFRELSGFAPREFLAATRYEQSASLAE